MYRRVLVLLLIFLLGVSIGQIIVAVRYGQCPFQPQLPVYLKVGGSLGIVLSVIGVIVVASAEDNKSRRILVFMILLSVFLFATRIPGSIYVFNALRKSQNTDPLLSTYCRQRLWVSALGVLIASYVLTGLTTLISIIRLVKD
jgi:hypothetical protein